MGTRWRKWKARGVAGLLVLGMLGGVAIGSAPPVAAEPVTNIASTSSGNAWCPNDLGTGYPDHCWGFLLTSYSNQAIQWELVHRQGYDVYGNWDAGHWWFAADYYTVSPWSRIGRFVDNGSIPDWSPPHMVDATVGQHAYFEFDASAMGCAGGLFTCGNIRTAPCDSNPNLEANHVAAYGGAGQNVWPTNGNILYSVGFACWVYNWNYGGSFTSTWNAMWTNNTYGPPNNHGYARVYLW